MSDEEIQFGLELLANEIVATNADEVLSASAIAIAIQDTDRIVHDFAYRIGE